MKYNYEEFIGGLSGNYADDLNAISDEVIRLKESGEEEAAEKLLAYGEGLIAEKGSAKDDDYRTIDINDEDYEKFYTLLNGVFAKVMDEDFVGAREFLLEMQGQTTLLTVGLEALEKEEPVRSFQSLEEEILYRVEHLEDQTPIVGPELETYLALRGGIALELKDYAEALVYLEKAIEVNPMSVVNRLSLSKIYRIKDDYKKAKYYNREAFKVACKASDFSACFSNEGYFLFKENQLDLALALSMLALEYDEENTEAEGNIILIRGKNPGIEPAEKKKLITYLKKEKIQGSISRDKLVVLENFAEKMEISGNIEEALEQYINLENLTKDEKYHQKIHQLMDKLDEHDEGHHHDHDCTCNHHDHLKGGEACSCHREEEGDACHCHHHGEEDDCCEKDH